MNRLKKTFFDLLASGTQSGVDDFKKHALQVANFDALLTILTLTYYSISSISDALYPLYFTQPLGLFFAIVGFFLIRYRYYDTGRYLIHFSGLVQIFITADAYPLNSGFEFYYVTSLIVPFITFSLEEHRKSIFLSACAGIAVLTQMYIGTGLITPVTIISQNDKIITMIIVLIYVIAVLAMARWQVNAAQKSIQKQQAELIHNSNLIALGEMSGGIAHEINNPLQTLALQTASIKRKLADVSGAMEAVGEKISTMDATIFRISDLVRGMKNLSRNVSNDPLEVFTLKDLFDVILLISSQRFENKGITFKVLGDKSIKIYGNTIQLSQVVINLLNNSYDAVSNVPDKWITIQIENFKNNVRISVMDSGPGVPKEVRQKIMLPFFTTKELGKGTGLGLSISRSIIEKWGGSLTYDDHSAVTRFVIDLPHPPEQLA